VSEPRRANKPIGPVESVVTEREPIALPDGRRLAVCEAGDPSGTVALYLHGTGSSRLEVGLYAAAARRHGLRLIAWDRPGSGGSDPQPGRTARDVISDARSVAASVGAERPVALGHSGGGSHVLVLASAGADVIRAAVAVNPGPPSDEATLAVLPRQQRSLIRLARDHPRLFAVFAAPSEGKGGPLVQRLHRRTIDPVDLAVVERPEYAAVVAAGAAEGRRQPRAFSTEALMLWHRPWDVDLGAFAVPLTVFAGERDPFVDFARGLAPAGADVHVMPGGHVAQLIPENLDRVLVTVAAQAQ
jgi:pimeloyl-ACP methyl ester carboxylesterase